MKNAKPKPKLRQSIKKIIAAAVLTKFIFRTDCQVISPEKPKLGRSLKIGYEKDPPSGIYLPDYICFPAFMGLFRA